VSRVFVLALVLFAFKANALDRPLILFGCAENRIDLPAQSDVLWLWNDWAEKDRKIEEGEFELTRDKGKHLVSLYDALVGVSACRHRVNGSWSSIYPVIFIFDPIGKSGVAREVKKIPDHDWRWVQGETAEGKPTSVPLRINETGEWRIETFANRIGSQLDSVVRVLDPRGREVARSDDTPETGRDSMPLFRAQTKGTYRIEVSDVSHAGGPNYFFALRASKAETPAFRAFREQNGEYIYRLSFGIRHPPNVPARISDFPIAPGAKYQAEFLATDPKDWYTIEAKENQRIRFVVHTRKFGSPRDAGLELFDSKGNLISESVGVEANGPSITNRFERAGTYRLAIRELSRKAKGDYWFEVSETLPGVVLNSELERIEFKDNEAKLKITCQRYDYDGPITFQLEGLPEGIQVLEATIPEKKNETEVKLSRTGDVPAFNMRIKGIIDAPKYTPPKEFPVSTMSALRKLYPLMLFPPAAMDGWIAVNPPSN
jgi:hypothetical protein